MTKDLFINIIAYTLFRYIVQRGLYMPSNKGRLKDKELRRRRQRREKRLKKRLKEARLGSQQQ